LPPSCLGRRQEGGFDLNGVPRAEAGDLVSRVAELEAQVTYAIQGPLEAACLPLPAYSNRSPGRPASQQAKTVLFPCLQLAEVEAKYVEACRELESVGAYYQVHPLVAPVAPCAATGPGLPAPHHDSSPVIIVCKYPLPSGFLSFPLSN
jgi:hypothetical protein